VAAGFDNNGNLICRPDQDSGGDITSVSGGTGLNGGSASGSVDLDVDYDDVQQRVSGSCPDGEFIDSIDRDGSVNCEPLSGSTNCSSSDFAKPSGGCPFDVNSVGIEDGPPCDEVAPGSYCEYDSSSGCGLNSSLDNCNSYDWYLKLD
jgi:hypothetical protein